jgi:hypothetical protein
MSGTSHHFFSCLQKPRSSLNNDHMLAATLRFREEGCNIISLFHYFNGRSRMSDFNHYLRQLLP